MPDMQVLDSIRRTSSATKLSDLWTSDGVTQGRHYASANINTLKFVLLFIFYLCLRVATSSFSTKSQRLSSLVPDEGPSASEEAGMLRKKCVFRNKFIEEGSRRSSSSSTTTMTAVECWQFNVLSGVTHNSCSFQDPPHRAINNI